MELNLTETTREILSAFLLIILPLVVIGLGIVFGIQHLWYYLLTILWFGIGFIFFGAIEQS
jgi:uncharacterized membrane protein YccC